MAIDLNTLSAKELGSLITQAKRRQTVLKKRKPITSVRKKLVDLAASEGYSIAELFGGKAPPATPRAAKEQEPSARKGRKLGKVPPKYRNPENPKETWTGRGKQPRWLAALVAKGKNPDDLLIKKK